MAADPWIVPWQRQAQNLPDVVNLHRRFEELARGLDTIRAYAAGEPYSQKPSVTAEGEKILSGQTAANIPGRN
jgi:GSH-dependent disulfide-bond oxidoreductase